MIHESWGPSNPVAVAVISTFPSVLNVNLLFADVGGLFAPISVSNHNQTLLSVFMKGINTEPS